MEQGKERGEQRVCGEQRACGERHSRGVRHAGDRCTGDDRRAHGNRPACGAPSDHGTPPAGALAALTVLAALALAVTLVFAGLLVCLAPPTTRLLAQATSMADVSPYTRDELVELACATLDYTMGSHNEEALLRAEAQALAAAADDGRCAPVPAAELFAAIDSAAVDASAVADLRAALAELPDTLVLPEEALSHLDDCYAVVSVAVPVLAAVALAAVALLVACGVLDVRRSLDARRPPDAHCSPDARRRPAGRARCLLGTALTAGGGLVLAAFAVLGVWALLDFPGLFAAFHSLFFAEGTWKFPWDSLLICMYPDAFWTGMAAVWASTTAVCSAACVAAGLRRVRRRRR